LSILCKPTSRMYSRNAAGLRDEPGCCRHGNVMPLSRCRVGGGDRFWSSATSDDDVCGFCSSKNADVTGDDGDVFVKTARCDDVAVDVWRELQRVITPPCSRHFA